MYLCGLHNVSPKSSIKILNPCVLTNNFCITIMSKNLLVCTRTQHWTQLTSRLVPSSAKCGLDSCPSPHSFVLLVLVLKHTSGMSGLDHCWSPWWHNRVLLELLLLNSDFRQREQKRENYCHVIKIERNSLQKLSVGSDPQFGLAGIPSNLLWNTQSTHLWMCNSLFKF